MSNFTNVQHFWPFTRLSSTIKKCGFKDAFKKRMERGKNIVCRDFSPTSKQTAERSTCWFESSSTDSSLSVIFIVEDALQHVSESLLLSNVGKDFPNCSWDFQRASGKEWMFRFRLTKLFSILISLPKFRNSGPQISWFFFPRNNVSPKMCKIVPQIRKFLF